MSKFSRAAPTSSPLQSDTELFDAMAREVHVDLDKAAASNNGEAITRARTRCRDCEAVEECERWLDTSVGIPMPPAFCPNAPFFHLCIAAAHDDTFDPP